MEQQKKVKLYAISTCSYCKKTKAFLDDNKIQYEYYDVGTDKERRDEMMDKSGQMSVPVIDVGGKIVIGFNKTAIKEALGI
jgi:glutaredoxin 3